MDRVNKILAHGLFQKYVSKTKEYEENRIFCKHDMCHLLDVCRIAEILWLEYRIAVREKTNKECHRFHEVQKEYIYAAGLLHDIGRWQEYESGVRHEIAGSKLAPEILEDCGFDEDEIVAITSAILNHRNKEIQNENNLSGWIYRADKKSRACFACDAESLCDWSREKKNLKLT